MSTIRACNLDPLNSNAYNVFDQAAGVTSGILVACWCNPSHFYSGFRLAAVDCGCKTSVRALLMTSSTMDSSNRMSSADAYNCGIDAIGQGSHHGGPYTVFFRLVSGDVSPGHGMGEPSVLQPITPLHTPFTQSPIQSPIQQSSPSLGTSFMTGPISSGDHMLYPLPPPSAAALPPMLHGQSTGVYYTPAVPTPPQSFFASNPARFADPGMMIVAPEHQQFMKQRAMSAEIQHSPPFHYAPPQPHRSSFCLPMNEKDLALVSEEMLLSAMPERYDD